MSWSSLMSDALLGGNPLGQPRLKPSANRRLRIPNAPCDGGAMPFWAGRFFEELSAAPCKRDARRILKSGDELLTALDKNTRERIRTKAQDIIAELPD
jgi:hypothetical protein